ncbi:unnamed protein product [Arabidopsis thaliana]|uniref:(thale cress) hypothetical protein n=1 Tax=Arabidopsis thaliana TaxID=3702 RepID=A0A7G2EVJ9_ARATH|nr:unnamed protein product [Arabidopsis thaliana]
MRERPPTTYSVTFESFGKMMELVDNGYYESLPFTVDGFNCDFSWLHVVVVIVEVEPKPVEGWPNGAENGWGYQEFIPLADLQDATKGSNGRFLWKNLRRFINGSSKASCIIYSKPCETL